MRDRADWGSGIETCEKNGILVITLPIARGVQLIVSDRAAVRPEVASWVREMLSARGAGRATTVGVQPLGERELAASRARFGRFLADARAAGTEPIVG